MWGRNIYTIQLATALWIRDHNDANDQQFNIKQRTTRRGRWTPSRTIILFSRQMMASVLFGEFKYRPARIHRAWGASSAVKWRNLMQKTAGIVVASILPKSPQFTHDVVYLLLFVTGINSHNDDGQKLDCPRKSIWDCVRIKLPSLSVGK